MSELDDEWKQRLDDAMRRAAATGRGDVADYVRLRQVNDEARGAGMAWLFETFTRVIGRAVRGGTGVSAERAESHRFAAGGATMVGERLVFRHGVRTLTIEAGYPRTPQDGFVQGGGLARAVVHHFGDARAGTELTLVREADELSWYEVRDHARGDRFDERTAERHVSKFLGMNA